MRPKASLPQLVIHSTAAVILTLLTGMFGAPFLRVIRKSQGALRFWSVGTFLALGMWFAGADVLAIMVGSIWLTLGLYSELEEIGSGWWKAGLLAIGAGTAAGTGGFIWILRGLGITNWERFVDLIREKMSVLQEPLGDSLKLDPEMLAQQAPSAWLIMLVLCLGTALIFEDRLFLWVGLPRERVASRLKLLEFRLPDFWIWVTLTAFLLTMVDFGSKSLLIAGANVVNVSVVLYFFQGLAVLEVLLNSLKAGAFMRAVVYIIIVGQLFFLLSAVGLIDFWVDFRKRLRKSGTPIEKDTSRFGGSI